MATGPTKGNSQAQDATVIASPKRRPRSAQPRRPAPPSRSAPAGTLVATRAVDPARALGALQRQCTDLKCAANTITEDTIKTKTRLMALERELQKRDRLLRQMALLQKAGQGINMDIIEKLREERHMLPIYRRRAQELQVQIEEKDQEIKSLKRDQHFTRIIELQVEYASWQHEAKRLDSLIQEPNPNVNPAAKREAEVQSERVQKLEAQLQAVEDRRANLADELAELETDHAAWMQTYQEREQELSRQQDLTREVAISFKKLLQDRKQAEQLQDELEEMALNKKHVEEDLAKAEISRQEELQAYQPPGRYHVTEAFLLAEQPPCTASPSSALWSLRRAGADCVGDDSLFARCMEHDQDADGLLTMPELVATLRAWQGCRSNPDEAAAVLKEHYFAIRGVSDSTASPRSWDRIRWLDMLVMLDRLTPPPEGEETVRPDLPELRPLRAACIRSGMSSEALQTRLLELKAEEQARAFFTNMGLDRRSVPLWVAAWQSLGTYGLVQLLPLSEASRSEISLKAWKCRCADAVRSHKKELAESFTVWRPDMLLTEAQFQMVCNDVMGIELLDADIDDLALLVGAGFGTGETVQGSQVLQLAS